MAGGQGTRFWPWSTAEKPKQFLAVVGKQPLITQTYRRLRKFITASEHLRHRRPQIPGRRPRMPAGIPAPQFHRRAGAAQHRAGPHPGQYPPLADRPRRQPAGGSGRPLHRRRKDFRRPIDGRPRSRAKTAASSPPASSPREPHTGYGYIQFLRKRSTRGSFYPDQAIQGKTGPQDRHEIHEKGQILLEFRHVHL